LWFQRWMFSVRALATSKTRSPTYKKTGPPLSERPSISKFTAVGAHDGSPSYVVLREKLIGSFLQSGSTNMWLREPLLDACVAAL
jgi:hypothetical protein